MRFARSMVLLAAVTGSASLVACGPVHSVTIGRGAPPYSGPPVVVEEEGNGPPPWAPAHGYRHKHQRAYQSREQTVDLVFDSNVGVYVVVGIPNYYYWDGAYLRLEAGHWWRAQYLDASWTPCPAEALPGNLRSKPVTRYRGPPRDHRADWDHDRGYGHGRGHGHGHDDDDDEQ